MNYRTVLTITLASVALSACSETPDPADEDAGAHSHDAGHGAPDGSNELDSGDPSACDAEPTRRTTPDGVAFVRTPDSCFEGLPGWSFEPHYVELDGLRQAYVDEGPDDGPVVLLLHGQPTWSYLYRDMIPVLAQAGFRVIAMDHLGMGRSDKPTEIGSYSYLGHADRLTRFIEELDLTEINLFVQDWGSLIGLRVAGLNPDRFARIAVGNGVLPVIPAGVTPFPDVEDPDVTEDIDFPFAAIPDQQTSFYDGCDRRAGDANFGDWMTYAMKAEGYRPSEVVEALTWFPLPDDEEVAYDAPFPSRTYMAGTRVFPSLVNELPGLNADAWAGLTSFERPFLTLWASNDPGNQGSCEAQAAFVDAVPGARGLPHARLAEASHFLQDDQGDEIARRLSAFFRAQPTPLTREARYCELLLVRLGAEGPEAEVWGTQGMGTCPQEGIDSLDLDAIAASEGAVQAIVNGPRHWIPNATSGEVSPTSLRVFGELPMLRLATLSIDPSQSRANYTETTVFRTTTYTFDAGEEIYELTSSDGETYVMQSLSLILDPTLTFDDLPSLAERLTLPEGWTYSVRTLDDELVLGVDGEATVLTDDLGNTYQKR